MSEQTILKTFIILLLVFSLVNAVFGYSVYSEIGPITSSTSCPNTFNNIITNMQGLTLVHLITSSLVLFLVIMYLVLDYVRFRGKYDSIRITRILFSFLLIFNAVIASFYLSQVENITICFGEQSSLGNLKLTSILLLAISILGFIISTAYFLKQEIEPEKPKEKPKDDKDKFIKLQREQANIAYLLEQKRIEDEALRDSEKRKKEHEETKLRREALTEYLESKGYDIPITQPQQLAEELSRYGGGRKILGKPS